MESKEVGIIHLLPLGCCFCPRLFSCPRI